MQVKTALPPPENDHHGHLPRTSNHNPVPPPQAYLKPKAQSLYDSKLQTSDMVVFGGRCPGGGRQKSGDGFTERWRACGAVIAGRHSCV